MFRGGLKARVLVAVAAIAAIGLPVLPLLPVSSAAAGSPGVDDHGVVANVVPFKYTPNFTNGAVKAIVQVTHGRARGSSSEARSPP